MVVNRDYVTWCQKCDYGIEGDVKEKKKTNRIEQLYKDLSRQQSQAIYNQIIKHKTYQPTWSGTRILIYFLAAIVHLLSVTLFVRGLLLLITQWRHFVILVFALFFIFLAWYLRPRPLPEPKDGVLTREEFPALYGLVDQVAKPLGTHIDQIAVNEWFNASYSQTGLRRKKTLTLGYPLWEVLYDQERIALLAHEIAHDVNGDQSRSFFVGTAVDSLIKWYLVIVPDPLVGPAMNIMDIFQVPAKLVASAVAGMVWAYYRLLTILIYRDMQRAEYLADRLGASIVGCKPYITSLRKTLSYNAFRLAVQHCALDRKKSDFYHEFHALIENIPESELERIQKLEERSINQLDVTHPPTGLRIKMLLEVPVEESSLITAEPGKMRQIDNELSIFRKKIQTKLINNYHAALFY